jgi:hypothetical protein
MYRRKSGASTSCTIVTLEFCVFLFGSRTSTRNEHFCGVRQATPVSSRVHGHKKCTRGQSEICMLSSSPAGQDGRTSLIAAALNGHRDALEVLLEAKADINAVGEVRSDGSVYRGLDWESDWWWVVLSYMR